MLDTVEDAVERNYARDALSKAEIERIVRAVGSVDALLNTRHATAKANGWKDKTPSRTAFVTAAVKEPNLLRRPVIVRGGRGIVSRDLDEIRAFLK